MTKKKELGKGIRALLGNMENSKENAGSTLVKTVPPPTMLNLEQIENNIHQPRNYFDEDLLDELATSIKVHGLIQPITVRHLGADKYQIISGERRYRAAKLAKLEEIPVYVREASQNEMLELALIENIQRSDLNAMEVAISYQRLIDECQWTHEDLSGRVGKNRSTVTNYIRLLKLAPEIQKSIKANEITMGHARALAGISGLNDQLKIWRAILTDSLSVRGTEKKINALSQPIEKKEKQTEEKSPTNPFLKDIEEKLTSKLETKVQIIPSKDGSGQILIKYADTSHLNGILDRLD